MSTSRRAFLKHGTLGAIAAGVSLSLTNKTMGRGLSISSSVPLGLNRAAFEAQLNTTFLINHVKTKLVEVVDLGSRKAGGISREAFSLIFRGDKTSTLKQDTYTIEHEKLGGFSFLVVPIISTDKGFRYYEVVVNRLHR